METNEIMMNEEVIETAEEIVRKSPNKALKVAGIGGVAVLGGFVAYKYVIKPAVAKFKRNEKKKEFEKAFNVRHDDSDETEIHEI